MSNVTTGILPKNHIINKKFKIILLVKKGVNAETYRVKAEDGKLYYLKLFNYSVIHHSAFDSLNNLIEIEILKKVKHKNIPGFIDSGELIYNGKKYAFLILKFIVGEYLSDIINRNPIKTLYDIKQFALGILDGLEYLHTLPSPVIHNNISPQSIMIDLSEDIPKPVILDFDFARYFHESSKSYCKDGINLYYIAPECFNNLFSPQSDIFSMGALMYHMLFGIPPWFKEIYKYKAEREDIESIIFNERLKPLLFPQIENAIPDFDDSIIGIIKKALSINQEDRFRSAAEFIQAIKGELNLNDDINSITPPESRKKSVETGKNKINSKKTGFAAIAGMQELKDTLTNDVIDLMNDPEGAEKYNVSMPNGMLLYGPPGCGKTFFAEKFAEETGFNYKYVNPSELGSIYVHGTQEKIGNLFKEARTNAPFIICLDEVSSIFPSRDNSLNHQIGEVDEFLTQLNNCGKDGVFVIALTNFPENIDNAVLRAGRIDVKIFVPPPDFEARKALFQMYLEKIPTDFGIDYDKLASITENYVSSDIKLIVENLARSLRRQRGRVTMELLENSIKNTKPSVRIDIIKRHEKIRKEFENDDSIDRKIGF